MRRVAEFNIPDLTLSGGTFKAQRCLGAGMYLCTRPLGHSGRHAAGTGVFIVAVWGVKA